MYCRHAFSPAVTSLRGLQQASEWGKVQELLNVKRTSLGSLSEARSVFDPEWLGDMHPGQMRRHSSSTSAKAGSESNDCGPSSLSSWLVNFGRRSIEHFGGVHDGFGQGRVRMDAFGQIASGGPHLDGQDCFADQISRVGAANANA